MRYNYAQFSRQIRREMSAADELYVRASTLRALGRSAEADRLEYQAERIDNRHAKKTYSTWLDGQ